jgi:hypothetical protein
MGRVARLRLRVNVMVRVRFRDALGKLEEPSKPCTALEAPVQRAEREAVGRAWHEGDNSKYQHSARSCVHQRRVKARQLASAG